MKVWRMIVTLMALPLIFSGSVFAETTKIVEEEAIVEAVACVHGKETRRLEVHTKEAGCRLQYFKFGKSSEIALARRGVEVCREGLKRVRRTLEGSGYQCK